MAANRYGSGAARLAETPIETTAGFIGGAGGTLLAREYLDQPGSNSIFRPSVLYGLGLGSVGLAASYLNGTGALGMPEAFDPALFSFGLSALAAGGFSTLIPKGATSATTPSMAR